MNTQKGRRQVNRLITILFVASACSLIAVQPAISGKGQPLCVSQAPETSSAEASPSTRDNTDETPGGASGLLIHIDPQTGRFLKEPAPGTVPLHLSPEAENALSTSHQGLVEEPSTVPGGGVKVDLQGRFQSPVLATTDAKGKLRLLHPNEMQEPSSPK